MNEFGAALLLSAGYNAALVAVGAALLGAIGGATGVFLLLRKRSLVTDAVAHATLPGVACAFLLSVWLGGDGRSMWLLMLGAGVSAWLGLLAVEAMTRFTRLGEDTAIGAVLSVFFGAGVVLLTVVQSGGAGRQAGLEAYLLGETAGMLRADAVTLAVAGLCVALVLAVFRRPLILVAFDPSFAQSIGVRVRLMDMLLMFVSLAVVVIGLRIVGLVLIVALLIIPAAAARFWTERVGVMVWIAAAFGGLSGWGGAAVSAAGTQIPTGPVIVLIAAAFFLVSLLAGLQRGVLLRILRARPA